MKKLLEEILGEEVECWWWRQEVYAECERYGGEIEAVKVEASWSPEYEVKLVDPARGVVRVEIESIFEFLYSKINNQN
jgi:hypothetical protein